MLATLLIVFREAIEAGLIVGIVLAATRGVPGRGRVVAFGMAAGLLGACIVAAFAGTLSDAFQGAGQELFNASVLWLAVLMLGWHTVWMSRHGRALAAEVGAVGRGVAEGARPIAALAVVVGIAVLREGAEVVLFLSGIALSGTTRAAEMAVGGVAGLLGGATLAALTYYGLVRLPTRLLFAVTGWLVTLLAAGMAAQAVGLLQAAGWFPALARTIWDSSRLLPESGIGGRMLQALVGYTDRPSVLQVIAWIATLAVILLLARMLAPRPRLAAPAQAVR